MLYPKFVYLELSFSIILKIHFVLKGTGKHHPDEVKADPEEGYIPVLYKV
jgi:hypothetical protein